MTVLIASHLLPLAFSIQVLESPLQRLENKQLFARLADTSDQCKRWCMVAEQVSKPSVFQSRTFSPVATAAMQMPMMVGPVTNQRLETVLLGIATQIASGMSEVGSEMSALINEAERCWQIVIALSAI